MATKLANTTAAAPSVIWILSLANKRIAEITVMDFIILLALWMAGGFLWVFVVFVQGFIETRRKTK